MLSESRAQIQSSEAIPFTSMRCTSDNVQFSRMQNTIVPQANSSQLYGYGFNEIVSDTPQQMDSKLNTHDSNLYRDSSLHNQHGVFDIICSQSLPVNNYQSGPSSSMTIKRLDYPPFGANHLTTKDTSHVEKIPGQPNEIFQGIIRNARKRPIENVDIRTKRIPANIAGNRVHSNVERTTNKKMAVPFHEKLQHQQIPKEIKEVQKDKVPVRRSQKLADKITALQKLVSPYGKTDTASVLLEASVFIKGLQDQIQTMFHRIRSSSAMDNEYPQLKITEDKQLDLRSKGFCLVPMSFTHNLIKEDAFNPYSMANTMLPQNKLTHF